MCEKASPLFYCLFCRKKEPIACLNNNCYNKIELLCLTWGGVAKFIWVDSKSISEMLKIG